MHYQTLSRQWRPKKFSEVLGQDAVVTTLKNALSQNRLGHAYLFSGPRGCGKTTFARLVAMALNCPDRTPESEPCGTCSFCLEITQGASLNVIEIDGASNRGIDDIRELNESVGYAATSGGQKVYIIDEVHMLTKEAFNALLKTLEEPPPLTKFLFATTELHKVPPTIISRCQRFALKRLPPALIIQKLKQEAKEAKATITEEALNLIAKAAEGGMRDAESLLDQMIAFHGQNIDEEAVCEVLGLPSQELFFRLDAAAKGYQLEVPSQIAEELYTAGKDFEAFYTHLLEHYRILLLIALKQTPPLPSEQLPRYQASSACYTPEQLLTLLDLLLKGEGELKKTLAKRVTLEVLLTHPIRIRHRLPLETITKKLTELQKETFSPQKEPLEKPSSPPVKEIATLKPPIEKIPQKGYDTILRFAAVELEGRLER